MKSTFVKLGVVLTLTAMLGVAAPNALADDYEGVIFDSNLIWDAAGTWTNTSEGVSTFPNSLTDTATMTWENNGDLDLGGGSFSVGTFTIMRNGGNPDIVNGSLTVNEIHLVDAKDTDFDVTVTAGSGPLVLRNDTWDKIRLNGDVIANNGLTFTGTGSDDIEVDTDGGHSFGGALVLDYAGQARFDGMSNNGTTTWESISVTKTGLLYWDDHNSAVTTWDVTNDMTVADGADFIFKSETNTLLNVMGDLVLGVDSDVEIQYSGRGDRSTTMTINGGLLTGANTNVFNLDPSTELNLLGTSDGTGSLTINNGSINASAANALSASGTVATNNADLTVAQDALGTGAASVAGGSLTIDGTQSSSSLALSNVIAEVNVDNFMSTAAAEVSLDKAVLNLNEVQTAPVYDVIVGNDSVISGDISNFAVVGTLSGAGGEMVFQAGSHAPSSVADSVLDAAGVADNSVWGAIANGTDNTTIDTSLAGNKRMGVSMGSFTVGDVVGTYENLAADADLDVRVVGDATVAGATFNSGSGIANWTSDSSVTLTAASLGTVTEHNFIGLGDKSQTNDDLLVLDGSSVVSASQTYTVTDGRIRVPVADANAGTVIAGVGGTLYLNDTAPSTGVYTINGGALYVDKTSRLDDGATFNFNTGSMLWLNTDITGTASAGMAAALAAADVIVFNDGGDDDFDSNLQGLKTGARLSTSATQNADLADDNTIINPGSLSFTAAPGRKLEIKGDVQLGGPMIVGASGPIEFINGGGSATRQVVEATGTVELYNKPTGVDSFNILSGTLKHRYNGVISDDFAGDGRVLNNLGHKSLTRNTFNGDWSGFHGTIYVNGGQTVMQSALADDVTVELQNHLSMFLLDGIDFNGNVDTDQSFNDERGVGSTGAGGTFGGFFEGGESNVLLTEGDSTLTLKGDVDGFTPLAAGTPGTYGADNKPGKAGVDDDGNGKIDDAGEYMFEGSDDTAAVAAYYSLADIRSSGYEGAIISTNVNGGITSPNTHVLWKAGEGTLIYEAGFDANAWAREYDQMGNLIKAFSEGDAGTGEAIASSNLRPLAGDVIIRTEGAVTGGYIFLSSTEGLPVTNLQFELTRTFDETISVTGHSRTNNNLGSLTPGTGGVAEANLKITAGNVLTHSGELNLGGGTLHTYGQYVSTGNIDSDASGVLDIVSGLVRINGTDVRPSDPDGIPGNDDDIDENPVLVGKFKVADGATLDIQGRLGLSADLWTVGAVADDFSQVDISDLILDGTLDIGQSGVAISGTTYDDVVADVLAEKIVTSGELTVAVNDDGSGNIIARYAAGGDANLDQAVSIGDLGILAGNYGMTGGATWNMGDFNGDGAVSIGDLGILAGNYGLDYAPAVPAPTAVPEPASLALLGLGGLAMLRRRRRKA